MLGDNLALLDDLTENPVAARLLKKCASPRYPDDLTPAQVERLEAIIRRMDDAGTSYRPEELRDYLYQRRDDIDGAIDDIEFAAQGSSDELLLMSPDDDHVPSFQGRMTDMIEWAKDKGYLTFNPDGSVVFVSY